MDAPTIRDLLEHREFVRRLAYGLAGDEQTADDLVQETWLAGLERPPRDARNLRGWLRTVAARVSRRHRARARRELDLARELSREGPGLVSASARGDVLPHAVSEAVLALREPYRSVVLLRFFEGLPPREISRRTGRPVNTVQSQIRRALIELRERLDRDVDGGRAAWTASLVLLAHERELAPATAGTATAAGVAGGAWLASGLAVLALALTLFGAALWSDSGETGAPDDLAGVLASAPAPVAGSPALAARAPESPRAVATSVSPLTDSADSVPTSAAAVSAAASAQSVLVVDADGRPVEGARVVVSSLDGDPGSFGENGSRYAGTTDAAGLARIALEPGDFGSFLELAGCVFLSAEAAGRTAARGTYVVPPLEGAGSVQLRLGPFGRRVRGRVLGPEGAGVAGARIRLGATGNLVREGEGRIEIRYPLFRTTGPDGSFEFDGVLPGGMPIILVAEGFAPAVRWLDPEGPATEELVLRLVPEARLEGVVRDESGTPVAGAHVWVEPELEVQPDVRTTDAEGRYALTSLPQGWRFAWALAPGDARCARAKFVLAPGLAHEWSPVLRDLPPLALRLVDEEGAPRAGLWVALQLQHDVKLWTRFVTTDTEGRIVVRDCPDEPVRASVFDSEAAMRNHEVPLAVVGSLLPAVEAHEVLVASAPPPPARIFGLVLDAEGRPPASVQLFLIDREHESVQPFAVDPEIARFDLREIAAGRYTLVVYAGAIGAWSAGTLELDAGSEHDLGTLRLPRPGSLQLEWGWPEGITLELLQILEGKHWTVGIDAAPSSGARALLPGQYRLRVLHQGRTRELRNLRIDEGASLVLASGPIAAVETRIEIAAGGGAPTGERASLRAWRDVGGVEEPRPWHGLELVRDAEGRLGCELALLVGGWRVEAETESGLAGEVRFELTLGPSPPPVVLTVR